MEVIKGMHRLDVADPVLDFLALEMRIGAAVGALVIGVAAGFCQVAFAVSGHGVFDRSAHGNDRMLLSHDTLVSALAARFWLSAPDVVVSR